MEARRSSMDGIEILQQYNPASQSDMTPAHIDDANLFVTPSPQGTPLAPQSFYPPINETFFSIDGRTLLDSPSPLPSMPPPLRKRRRVPSTRQITIPRQTRGAAEKEKEKNKYGFKRT